MVKGGRGRWLQKRGLHDCVLGVRAEGGLEGGRKGGRGGMKCKGIGRKESMRGQEKA